MNDDTKKFKIVIVGDVNVGKTSYINKLLHKKYEKKYTMSENVGVHDIYIHSNYGKYSLVMCDIPGNRDLYCTNDIHYIDSDAYIYIFDLNKSKSFNILKNLIKDSIRIKNNFSRILLGNKCDQHRVIPMNDINILSKNKKMRYIQISIKNDYNIYEPLQHLLRLLTNNYDLIIKNVNHHDISINN